MSGQSGPNLRCQSCGHTFALDSLVWRCFCGGIVDVKGTVIFPKEQLSQRPMNFWRYRESLALPDDGHIFSLGEVMTPLLESRFRHWNVSFKLEYMLPTGSYKDRGIAVCVNHLSSLGIQAVAEDSSGNAGASTAAYAAVADIYAQIFVPDGTSSAKVNQIRIYGAKCQLIPGTRSDSTREAQRARDGVYYMGHSLNPLFACGIKSIAYEIAEQSAWSPPDWIVTPLGGGSLVMGLIDGFNDLLAAGYVTTLPRILAVQSAACAPIYQAWVRNEHEVAAVESHPTLAEGVALLSPVRGNQVLQAIRRYNAIVLAVDDDELMSCWRDVAKIGHFIEPTSAVAVAGAWQAKERQNLFRPNQRVVIVVTGHGLKTKQSLIDSATIY